jgi:hypothetical protein
MIDKFNFYDIYGYFLPGLALLGVLWLPFGVVGHNWPPASWSTAIVGAAFAYILGHLLQSVGSRDLPSTIKKGREGRARYPSDMALDKDSELPAPLRLKIESLFRDQFNLDLAVDADPDKAIDKRRNVAFLLARQVLIREKTAGYAEQFQGMYALTRGLFVVLAVGSSYWLGWAGSIARTAHLLGGAVILLTVTLLFVINVSILRVYPPPSLPGGEEPNWWTGMRSIGLWTFLIGFLSAGYLLGLKYAVTGSTCVVLVVLSAIGLLGSLRIYGAYKGFAQLFAATVWRGFLAYQVKIGEGSAIGKK